MGLDSGEKRIHNKLPMEPIKAQGVLEKKMAVSLAIDNFEKQKIGGKIELHFSPLGVLSGATIHYGMFR